MILNKNMLYNNSIKTNKISQKRLVPNVNNCIHKVLKRNNLFISYVTFYDSVPPINNSYVENVKDYSNKNIKDQNRFGTVQNAPEIVNNQESNTQSNEELLTSTIIDKYEKHQDIQQYIDMASLFLNITFGILIVIMIITTLSNIIMNIRGGGINRSISGFISSKGYEKDSDKIGVTFADVAGLDSAKAELQEIVDFLKNPDKYANIGAKIPKGCLLTGGPGLGKTMLAKAIAGEAGVPFFSCSASEFIEMFVGVGASRIRDMFQKAKAKSPCIVFIDEIDAIGKSRSSNGMFSANDEREQTINQLLTEMDGFETRSGIIVIAATNRPDILDSALVRPGRFDRQIVLDIPGVKAREAILKVHAKGKPFKDEVNFENVAKNTAGFSGAELANLINESAICAARRNNTSIANDDIEQALERIMLGLEKKDTIISFEKKRLVAYHEAGHALVALKIGDYDSIKKVTIVPRGKAGGVTIFEQNSDIIESGLYTKRYLENQLAVALGGRAAEELVMGPNDITTGASSDLERVQQIARAMIMKFGFSDKLGQVSWKEGSKLESSYSESTLREIDREVKLYANKSYERAMNILNNNKELLQKIAELLLEKETINGDDIKDLDKKCFKRILY